MARRNDHTREELRELALRAAEQVVQTQGVEALSTRKVAAGIGYSVGSLYSVFSNLDDLCWQLNMRTLGELLDQIETVHVDDPHTRLHDYAILYLHFAQRHPERWRLLFVHRSAEGKEMPAALAAQIGRLFGHVDLCLKDLFHAWSDDVVSLRARTLWSGVHGIVQLRLGDKLFLDDAQGADQMLALLIDGLIAGWQQEGSRHA